MRYANALGSTLDYQTARCSRPVAVHRGRCFPTRLAANAPLSIQDWRATSILQWTHTYLQSPCHTQPTDNTVLINLYNVSNYDKSYNHTEYHIMIDSKVLTAHTDLW